jgi:hypothetical protein
VSAGSFAKVAATASVPDTLDGATASSSTSRRSSAIRGAASSAVSASISAAPRDGALERERRDSVAAAETCAGSVEHLERLVHAALDLEHPSERKGDRDLSGRIAGGIKCRLQVGRCLPVSRVGLGEAELEQHVGELLVGGRLLQRPP